ncbi:MAG: hypothetical protein AAF530_25335 [Pseudomonadota bacterium]
MAPPAIRKIPFDQTIRFAYWFLGRNLGAFFMFAWAPMLFGLVGTFAAFILVLAAGATDVEFWLQPPLFLAYSIIAVFWHRFALIKGFQPRLVNFALWKREFLFVLTSIGLFSFFYGGVWFIVFEIPDLMRLNPPYWKMGPGTFVLLLVSVTIGLALICVRLSMIFPRIAKDQSFNLLACWRMTKGNGWRLLLGHILCVAPWLAGNWILGVAIKLLSATSFGTFFSAPLFVVAFLILTLMVAVSAGFLSRSYMVLSGDYSKEELAAFDLSLDPH